MKHAQRGRRRLWLPAAALAAMSFVGAAFTLTEESSSAEVRPSLAAPALLAPVTAPVTPSRVNPSAAVASALPATGAPQRVYIDSLGIDAPVLAILTDGNTLTPPPDPQDLGWWADGALPGAAIGSALITGHTVHDGGGALDDLETLKAGTEIRVRTTRGIIRYVAQSVDVLDKDTIARRAPQLFNQEVDGRLVLVTCEDWDGTGYRSNVVVTAIPVA